MDFIQIFTLSFIQGFTEFLPISSSGHLALIPLLTGWKDQGQLMDIALHVGTLFAILVFFFKDVFRMIVGFIRGLFGAPDEGTHLTYMILIGSIPAIVVGFTIVHFGFSFRSLTLIATNTVIFGLLLGLADKAGTTGNRLNNMTYAQAFLVGMGQSLALIPGVSRSGMCMTISRMLGFERVEATRFTFLLAIPAVLGAAVLTGIKTYHKTPELLANKQALYLMGGSFFFGIIAIRFIMNHLKKGTLMPFVIYRIILGAFLYFWANNIISINPLTLPTP